MVVVADRPQESPGGIAGDARPLRKRRSAGLYRFGGLFVFVVTLLMGVQSAWAKSSSGAGLSCPLQTSGIAHVIYLQFDNVHLQRDIPGVPSDLEQMPHLLNFLKNNGTVLNKHYTILISHTAGGILSSLTGLYPDRMGITESNSYDYYRPNNTPTFTSAFKYWTSPVAAAPNDTLPNLITDGQKIIPAEKYGLQVISMGFLTGDDAPIIWRGPMLHGVIQQFFREVRWLDLDYLVIDMPPGTGDVALSLSQTVPVAGAIVVTTPQEVSLADSRRAIAMYKKLNIPPIGVIENMSYFVCRNCHHEADIFGHGGGERMAAEMGVPFLGSIPIYQPIREGGDSGVPLIVSEPESPAARSFMAVAERTAAQLSIASYNKLPTIPLTVVR